MFEKKCQHTFGVAIDVFGGGGLAPQAPRPYRACGHNGRGIIETGVRFCSD